MAYYCKMDTPLTIPALLPQSTENKVPDATAPDAVNVRLQFDEQNATGFAYDAESATYNMLHADGTPQLDANNGQQAAFDNDSILRDSKSRRIAKINEYINNNYMNPIKLCDIAQLVSMSDSALSHFFKKRTNRNIVDYINDIRISNATKMLFETTNSISEIAFLCGFNNISNFNRIFKKNKGKTPSEYRESIQKIMIKY